MKFGLKQVKMASIMSYDEFITLCRVLCDGHIKADYRHPMYGLSLKNFSGYDRFIYDEDGTELALVITVEYNTRETVNRQCRMDYYLRDWWFLYSVEERRSSFLKKWRFEEF